MAEDITLLLRRYRDGDVQAFETLTRELYPELKALARARARGTDIGGTTLVHESYARYLKHDLLEPRNRVEFFGLIATIMRRIVIDEVRYARAGKRAGIEKPLDEMALGDPQPSFDFVLAVDRALDDLDRIDPRQRRVFECRYFAGYSTQETAEIVEASERTVERLWLASRRWIAGQVGSG